MSCNFTSMILFLKCSLFFSVLFLFHFESPSSSSSFSRSYLIRILMFEQITSSLRGPLLSQVTHTFPVMKSSLHLDFEAVCIVYLCHNRLISYDPLCTKILLEYLTYA